ncbi:MAG: hypothetical protein LBK82_11525 [Planctomycetaceae bacterium]|jgi:uncharacterized Zn finger protein (UPF0148 family)|nr:hypothetical protein [Planctomycetaceae bacterium]
MPNIMNCPYCGNPLPVDINVDVVCCDACQNIVTVTDRAVQAEMSHLRTANELDRIKTLNAQKKALAEEWALVHNVIERLENSLERVNDLHESAVYQAEKQTESRKGVKYLTNGCGCWVMFVLAAGILTNLANGNTTNPVVIGMILIVLIILMFTVNKKFFGKGEVKHNNFISQKQDLEQQLTKAKAKSTALLKTSSDIEKELQKAMGNLS